MENLKYEKDKIIDILKSLDVFIVALDQIGNSYADPIYRAFALSNFVQETNIFEQLTEARKVLSEKFSNELGEDDMSELEREFKDVIYWKLPSDQNLKNYLDSIF